MDKLDLLFTRLDTTDEYEDYWFVVLGDTERELKQIYSENSMTLITRAIYFTKEDVVGLEISSFVSLPPKREIIIVENEELKSIMIDRVNEMKGINSEEA